MFSTATSNAISVSDVDSDGNAEQVSLSVSNGTLTLSGTSGLSFSTGTGTGNSAMTFTGTLANINAALNGLTYTPTASYFGSDSLAITTNDLGNTGSGGAKTASSTVAITVSEVNQPPVNTVPGPQSVNEESSLVFSTATSNAISVSDVDSDGNAEQVSLSVSNGTLTLSGTSGLSFSTGTGTGNSAMTFTGTLANINAALNGLTYTPTASYFGSDSLAITTNDLGNTGSGGAKTASSTVAITVSEVNQPPVNTVPGPQSVNENASLVFSTATSNAISISDVDSDGNAEQVSLSVSQWHADSLRHQRANVQHRHRERQFCDDLHRHLGEHQRRAQWPDLHAHRQLLRQRQLGNSDQRPGQHGLRRGEDRQQFGCDHGERSQPAASQHGSRAAIVNENASLVFSTATSNAISVSDVDSDGNAEQVSLSVSNGTLTLSGTTGLTFSTGTGTTNSAMTFTGTLANINAALNGLTYTPTASYSGSDSLAIATNDLGNTGPAGRKPTAARWRSRSAKSTSRQSTRFPGRNRSMKTPRWCFLPPRAMQSPSAMSIPTVTPSRSA